MNRLSAIAVVLAAFSPCAIAVEPPPIHVSDVRGYVGDWLVLRADTPGEIVRWKAVDRGIRIAPPELVLRDSRTTLATASRPGVYRVHAVTAVDGIPSLIVEFQIHVSDDTPGPTPPGPVPPGPEPQPVPPTPPTPPAPTPPDDPIFARISAAIVADGKTAENLRHCATLAGFYQAMAAHVRDASVATVGDLLSDYRRAIPAVLPEGVILQVRRVCGEEVARFAGDDPAKLLDASLRGTLERRFTVISQSLAALR